jgi:hypothetical protein
MGCFCRPARLRLKKEGAGLAVIFCIFAALCFELLQNHQI